jgi:ABC-type glycerol-3-phosphate transport system substrate-binding protein
MRFILQFQKVSQGFHNKGFFTGRMRRPGLLALAVVLLCAGCSNDTSTTPTTTTPPPPAPGTEMMTAVMAPGGTAVRTFTASAPGTVTVTLTSTQPATVVGLGIGIPGSAAGGCDMTSTVNTSGGAAPQISAAVGAGDFCAGAFALSTSAIGSGGVLVSVTIVHP